MHSCYECVLTCVCRRAWQPDTTEGWVASTVVDKIVKGDKVRLVFKYDNGQVSLLTFIWNVSLYCLVQNRTVETTVTTLQNLDQNDHTLPPLMNPPILEASDDLTNLSHLNEPAGAV